MKKQKQSHFENLKSGRLTMLSHVGHGKWLCKCVCGVVKTVRRRNLSIFGGNTQSCGCLHREQFTHGVSATKAYQVLRNMILRCTDKHDLAYENYGGRGIYVCARWSVQKEGPLNFIEDMGQPPPGKTIDRIDNDGPYSKKNCRWVSRKVQQRNIRNNSRVVWKGRQRLLIELCEERDLSPQSVRCRLKAGWGVEEALTVPMTKKKPHRKKNET